MPSLDDLRKRISSVKSTQKITKAMKMVAAAKLRKAQEMAEKGRPYSDKMDLIIQNLSKAINDPSNAPKLLVGTGEDKTHLCVVMTADRGLCGGFNTNDAFGGFLPVFRMYNKILTQSEISQNYNTLIISPPQINRTKISTDNSIVSITFDEAVFNTNSGIGNLEVSDFSIFCLSTIHVSDC
mgnify:CR=1 FL=1